MRKGDERERVNAVVSRAGLRTGNNSVKSNMVARKKEIRRKTNIGKKRTKQRLKDDQ